MTLFMPVSCLSGNTSALDDPFKQYSVQASKTGCALNSHFRHLICLRHSDLFYSLTVGFVGAILFVLVDKYEPEGPLAHLLKFLVLFVAGVAILHRLQPYGLALF
jgi:hypothetical protein